MTVRRSRLFAMALLAGAMVSAGAAAASQATGSVTQDPRTGMIAGQIVDERGAPVPEANVTFWFNEVRRQSPLLSDGHVIADSQGRYFFTDLAAGSYSVVATKEGYAEGVYNRRSPDGTGSILTLKPGERRTDVTLTVWKFAIIAGTVLDEAGEPVVGVGVRALRRNITSGSVAFDTTNMYSTAVAVTDDRGYFRLPQLLPGSYVVFVPYTLTTVPLSTLDASPPGPRIRNSLSSVGLADMATRGEERAIETGDVALVNMTRVLAPPPANSAGEMQTYRAVYYPSAASPAEATPILLSSGDERTDIAIRMQPTTAVRISGRLVTPDGTPPPPMAIKLVGMAAAGIVDPTPSTGYLNPPLPKYETAAAMSDASGRFTLLGVPSGEYVIRNFGAVGDSAEVSANTPFWVAQSLVVGSGNIDDLVVTLRTPLSVKGRFQFSPSVETAALPSNMLFGVRFEGTAAPGFTARRNQQSGPLTFEAPLVAAGRYVAQLVDRGGWFVESVTMDGKDITDRAFDLQSDATSVVVSYTNQPSRISGSVKADRGVLGPDSMVVMFPADDARWKDYGPEPRILTSTTPSSTGEFVFAHIPPGDYFIAALEDEDLRMWRDPVHLKALTSQATRITVTPHNFKTVNLVSARAPR